MAVQTGGRPAVVGGLMIIGEAFFSPTYEFL